MQNSNSQNGKINCNQKCIGPMVTQSAFFSMPGKNQSNPDKKISSIDWLKNVKRASNTKYPFRYQHPYQQAKNQDIFVSAKKIIIKKNIFEFIEPNQKIIIKFTETKK